MSLMTMASEVVGQVPGIDYLFATSLVQRAWLDVQRRFLWSFLYGTWVIPTTVPVSAGSVTVTIGSPTVTGNAAATAAWAAIGLEVPITTQQFRVGQGTIYDIIGYTPPVSPAIYATLTLGQPYVDPAQSAGTGYSIMLNYPIAPVQDFLWFESITDPVSGYQIKTTLTREYVDSCDPQRFQSGWPIAFIPHDIYPYPNLAYSGWPRIEMWPAPVSGYTYIGTYYRSGAMFSAPGATVPLQLGEDVVLAKAKYYAYEWALANQNRSAKISKTGGFAYLMGKMDDQYDDLLNSYILKDESFSHRHVIDGAESIYCANLPWVSQKEGIGFFPS
jgi:hypothetical protein